eukprot:6402742-Amphidinium_carterae.1
MRISFFGGLSLGVLFKNKVKLPGMKNIPQPTVVRWSSAVELEKYMQRNVPIRIQPLVLNVASRWNHNWVHATFDGLYAAFVAACKFHRHRDKYLLLLGDPTKHIPENWKNWQPLSPYGRDDICHQE